LQRLSPEGLEAHHHLMADVYPDRPHSIQGHHIQHAGNAGEYPIPGLGYFVDGYCQDTNTVYEFHGCIWHGCPHCYPNRHEQHVRHCNRTLHDVYEKTQQRIRLLQALGYNGVENDKFCSEIGSGPAVSSFFAKKMAKRMPSTFRLLTPFDFCLFGRQKEAFHDRRDEALLNSCGRDI